MNGSGNQQVPTLFRYRSLHAYISNLVTQTFHVQDCPILCICIERDIWDEMTENYRNIYNDMRESPYCNSINS